MFRKASKYIYLGAALAALGAPGAAAGSEVLFRQVTTAELRYDTNANLSGSDTSSSGDLVVLLAPSFELTNDRGRTVLNALYRPTGYYYFRHPEINTVNHYATGSLSTLVTPKFSFEISDVFTYTKESLEASLINVQTGRYSIISNAVGVSMGYQATPNTSVSLGLTDSILDFKDPSASDTRTDSATAGWSYSATERTSLNMNYTFTYFTFKQAGAPSDSLETQSLSAGLTHRFPYSLTMDLSAGAVYAPSISGRFDWVANAGITKTFEYSLIALEYSRSTTNSAGLTNVLNLNERYGARWTYSFTDRFDLSVSGDYVLNHTKPVAVVDMESYDYVISGVWRLYSWLTLGAGYSHFQQISKGATGTDFKRDHFFINLTATTFERKF